MTLMRIAQIISKPSEIQEISADNSMLTTAIDFIIQLAAILSLIYVLVGAVRFSVSGGDPQKVASARNTLLYSIIGLVVSISAFTIATVAGEVGNQAANTGTPIADVATSVIGWLRYVVGAASVIGIIYGAIRYITSAGQPQSAQAGRNAIIYSVVGLVVAVAAHFIVTFVLEEL